MRVYRERLVVPAWWWVVSACCVVLLGTTLWAGFSVLTGVAVYVALEAACALIFLSWGSVRIEVTGTEVLAGPRRRRTADGRAQVRAAGGRRARLPLTRIAEVAAMDQAQTAALRGPRADPAAYMLIRPYLPSSVYVAVEGRPADEPYWLIGTRRPAELAAAIEQARSRVTGEPAWDDAGDEIGRRTRGADPVDAATQGRDGNAW
jgi:Protein of unknown function (DUF3093)